MNETEQPNTLETKRPIAWGAFVLCALVAVASFIAVNTIEWDPYFADEEQPIAHIVASFLFIFTTGVLAVLLPAVFPRIIHPRVAWNAIKEEPGTPLHGRLSRTYVCRLAGVLMMLFACAMLALMLLV